MVMSKKKLFALIEQILTVLSKELEFTFSKYSVVEEHKEGYGSKHVTYQVNNLNKIKLNYYADARAPFAPPRKEIIFEITVATDSDTQKFERELKDKIIELLS
jgi:hypothetical protein